MAFYSLELESLAGVSALYPAFHRFSPKHHLGLQGASWQSVELEDAPIDSQQSAFLYTNWREPESKKQPAPSLPLPLAVLESLRYE